MTSTKTQNGTQQGVHFSWANVDSLEPRPYNPPGRTNEKIVKALADSIKRVGRIVYPLLVTRTKTKSGKRMIIEGHRRLAAARLLGWTQVPVILTDDDDPDVIYAEVNGTSLRMSGVHALHVYLANPRAVMGKTRRTLEHAEKLVGRALMQELCSRGLAVATVRRAWDLMRYCNMKTPDMVRKCLKWMLKTGANWKAHEVMVAGVPPEKILAHVRAGTPLKVTFK